MNRMLRVLLVAIVVVLGGASISVYAWPSRDKPVSCSTCHSGGTFSVTITTDKTSLDFAGAGASETITITVSAFGASYVGFGIDVPDGYTASPSGSDVPNENNTQTVTITAGDGAVSGEAVIYGAAFNGNFQPTGDNVEQTTVDLSIPAPEVPEAPVYTVEWSPEMSFYALIGALIGGVAGGGIVVLVVRRRGT